MVPGGPIDPRRMCVANNMLLFPWPSDPSQSLHEDLLSFFRDGGLADPGPARGITKDELLAVLSGLAWPFTVNDGEDEWRAFYGTQLEDGTWPPIQEVSRHDDGSLGFRLGETYGPWAVSTRVAQVAGPHVALEFSGGEMCVVTGDMSFDEFHQELFGSPPGPGDHWPQPDSVAG
jgi:hypothetical protein